ncbi:MAG: hypothetical protein LUG99_23525 [Lachnospiraceae bacterium]|nr:hypothetical protein [Lachnospiraceae bacterium]
MNLYTIEEYVLNRYNASSKAREDVSSIVLSCGFKSAAKNDKSKLKGGKIRKILLTLSVYFKLLKTLEKDDVLFLQTSSVVLKGILRIKGIKKFQIIYLIHDIFPIRYDDVDAHAEEIFRELSLINQCEYVICHNEKMKERLITLGCTSKIYCLNIFDYLVDDASNIRERDPNGRTVAFAGNLSKSRFLNVLDEKCFDVKINVYGLPETKYSSLQYMGSLPAEQLPYKIEGNFGLIWEGGYQMTDKDNYLRYNNPHKASLYIVSGLPLIVWDRSAIADFVTKNRIGITISSLDELALKIGCISSSEYEELVSNCLSLRESLISGNNLKHVLDDIIGGLR